MSTPSELTVEAPAAAPLLDVLELVGLLPRFPPPARRAWCELWGRALVGNPVVATAPQVAGEFGLSEAVAGAVLEALAHLGGFEWAGGAVRVPDFDASVFQRELSGRERREFRAWRRLMSCPRDALAPSRESNRRLREIEFSSPADRARAMIEFSALDAALHVHAFGQAGMWKEVPELLRAFARMNFRERLQKTVSVVDQHEAIFEAVEAKDDCALDIALYEHSDHERTFRAGGKAFTFRGIEPEESVTIAADRARTVAGGTFVLLTRNVMPRAFSDAGEKLTEAFAHALDHPLTRLYFFVASPAYLGEWSKDIGRPEAYYAAFTERVGRHFESFVRKLDHAGRHVRERVRLYFYDLGGDFRNPNETYGMYLSPGGEPLLTARRVSEQGKVAPFIERVDSLESTLTFIATTRKLALEVLSRAGDDEANSVNELLARLGQVAPHSAAR